MFRLNYFKICDRILITWPINEDKVMNDIEVI